MPIKPLAAGLLLALGACTVGPDFKSPMPQAPAQAPFVSADAPLFAATEPPGRWWSLFGDQRLDALVEEALRANTDLRVAAANLARARGALREATRGRLPNVGANASVSYGRPSAQAMYMDEALATSETYDVGLDVNYQLDLFGRIRRAIEAGRADVEATQAALDVARISVVAETSRAFADVCGAGQQLAVARRSLAVQQQTFDLTRRQFEGGRGTALDTNQAGSLLDQTRAAIPTFEAQRQTALFRLAVLIGRPPASFPAEVADCTTPPALSSALPVGDGASLLARRPVIRAAERRLAAATARIGVATAGLYPDIRIGGSVGSTSTSIGDLGSGSALRFGIGPLISWSLGNVTLARARIAQAEADAQAALATFDGTWLRALEETESALTRYAGEQERVATLSRARDQSGEAARIARLRYEAGRENFQIVLEAERSLAQTEAALAQARAQLSTNLIALFLALGGGWAS